MSILENKKRLVIKIGSSLLVENGRLRKEWLQNFAENISWLIKKKIEIVVVTSGAIALGRSVLKKGQEKLSLPEKQAAAAIGQIKLMANYRDAFASCDLDVAQILLTLSDCNVRDRYLNSKKTIETLLQNQIIPVINENDTVAVDEIKIGDNDRLAARVAQMISADLLILFSDIDGLYDKNPRVEKDAKLISEVTKITKEIEEMASGAGSAVGTGGMITKIKAAKIAAFSNCSTVITSGIELDSLRKLMLNQQNFTIFEQEKSAKKSRKNWLAGLLNAKGEVVVNKFAKEALLNKKVSLLPIGVVALSGDFKKGEAIFIKDEEGNHIASGISNYNALELKKVLEKNSSEVKKILGDQAKTELVHIDNLVVVS